MHVRLLAFASASDALGTSELELELPEPARVADLRAWLDARYPALAPLWPRLAVAVNGSIARSDDPLSEGAEVALLPPVSGGSGSGEATAGTAARPKVELVDAPIDPQDVIARVASPACGAVLLFLGTVRDHSRRRDEAAAAVLNGRRDYVTAPENAHFVYAALQRSSQRPFFRIIKDAGHAVCQERPEEVARVIAEFLEAKTDAQASAK